MKSKKKNEMEKAQNTEGAAQEPDMDALEDVAGGYRSAPRLGCAYWDGPTGYVVYDDKGAPCGTCRTEEDAIKIMNEYGFIRGYYSYKRNNRRRIDS